MLAFHISLRADNRNKGPDANELANEPVHWRPGSIGWLLSWGGVAPGKPVEQCGCSSPHSTPFWSSWDLDSMMNPAVEPSNADVYLWDSNISPEFFWLYDRPIIGGTAMDCG